MNRARIVVLAFAIGAGGIAPYLASGSDHKPTLAEPAAQLPTIDVLVAKSDIGLGETVKPEDLQSQTWPTASSSFIKRPDAAAQVTGSIARSSFIAGEPIRDQKLVKVDRSGFMAAILPSDRVDVILTPRVKNSEHPNQPDIVVSHVILSNLRVLAIDQAPEEKDGQAAVVGKTVTLELKPEQIPTLSSARQKSFVSAFPARQRSDDEDLR